MVNNKSIADEIANHIKARLDQGGVDYDQPQITEEIILNDARDWINEAYEELLDGLFYLYAAKKRIEHVKQLTTKKI